MSSSAVVRNQAGMVCSEEGAIKRLKSPLRPGHPPKGPLTGAFLPEGLIRPGANDQTDRDNDQNQNRG